MFSEVSRDVYSFVVTKFLDYLLPFSLAIRAWEHSQQYKEMTSSAGKYKPMEAATLQFLGGLMGMKKRDEKLNAKIVENKN